jgi:hypothetical protein
MANVTKTEKSNGIIIEKTTSEHDNFVRYNIYNKSDASGSVCVYKDRNDQIVINWFGGSGNWQDFQKFEKLIEEADELVREIS